LVLEEDNKLKIDIIWAKSIWQIIVNEASSHTRERSSKITVIGDRNQIDMWRKRDMYELRIINRMKSIVDNCIVECDREQSMKVERTV
jgi:hypothetical protein